MNYTYVHHIYYNKGKLGPLKNFLELRVNKIENPETYITCSFFLKLVNATHKFPEVFVLLL